MKSSAVAECAERGRLEALRVLLADKRIDPNAPREFGTTPLYLAVENGNSDIVEELLKHPETDVNIPRPDGRVPLYAAVSLSRPKIKRLLLSHPKLNLTKARIQLASISSLKRFLDPDDPTTCGIFFLACTEGKTELVEELLGIPEIETQETIHCPTVCADTPLTPLYSACNMWFCKVVEVLMSNQRFLESLDSEHARDIITNVLTARGYYNCITHFDRAGLLHSPSQFWKGHLGQIQDDVEVWDFVLEKEEFVFPIKQNVLYLACESGSYKGALFLLKHPKVDVNHPQPVS